MNGLNKKLCKICKIILSSAVVLFTAIFINSCSLDNKLVNSVDNDYKILYAGSSTPNTLSIYDLNTQTVVQNDVFYNANSKHLEGNVSKMVVYSGKIYMVMPDLYKIKIIDKYSYKEIADISFKEAGYKPKDIAFANATDAYIIFSNTGQIALWDLYNQKNARFFGALTKPQSLLISSYYLTVTDISNATVSVFDTRDLHLIGTANVGDTPYYLIANSLQNKVAVVSLGNGKLDTNVAKTAAKISLINLADVSVVSTAELGGGIINAADQFPQGLTASPYDLAFIPTTNYLLGFNLRTPAGIYSLGKGSFRGIEYNTVHNKILFTMISSGKPVAAVANPSNGRIEQTFNLPDSNILTFLIL